MRASARAAEAQLHAKAARDRAAFAAGRARIEEELVAAARVRLEAAREQAAFEANQAHIAEEIAALMKAEADLEDGDTASPKDKTAAHTARGRLAQEDREAARIHILAAVDEHGGRMAWRPLYDVIADLGYTGGARVLGGLTTAGLLHLEDNEFYMLTDRGKERLDTGRRLLTGKEKR